jgi:hypothetical protein
MDPTTDIVIIRSGVQELRRQLSFRQTMLERRKIRLTEQLAADEWRIQELRKRLTLLEAESETPEEA